jgi:hypothetical protein
MSDLDIKSAKQDDYPAPREDEQPLALTIDWTKEEEGRAKRK